MAQPSLVRAENRFADAYLQPDYQALAAFDSADVTPAYHLQATPAALKAELDPFLNRTPDGRVLVAANMGR